MEDPWCNLIGKVIEYLDTQSHHPQVSRISIIPKQFAVSEQYLFAIIRVEWYFLYP